MKVKVHLLIPCLVAVVLAGVAVAHSFVSTQGLNNVEVGGQYGQVASIRFLAKSSAPLAAARVYWIITKTGYASGSGGQYTYSLKTDSNGQPGQVLTSAKMVVNQLTSNRVGNFPLICFPPVALVSGQYYDIVVQNVDPSPKVNWSSLDFLWNASLTNQTPDIQIWLSTEGGKFAPGDNGTFIGSPVALFYADGTVQGHGDIAIGSGYPGGYECGSSYGFPASTCQ